jgi:tetratricopeptide (TPR) repeat protein
MSTRASILIDKYLRNELSAQEGHEWDKIWKKPQVLKELAFRRDLMAAAVPEGRVSLKKELQALEAGLIRPEEEKPEVSPTVIRPLWTRPRAWAAAAILLVLSAALYSFLQKDSSTSAQALYAEAWQPYPNELTLRLRSENSPSLRPIDAAMLAYEQGNYTEAIGLLNKIAEPADSIAFYRANALLAQGNLEDAKVAFDDMAARGAHPYQQASAWYQALIEVRTGAWQSAERRLETIATNDAHPFATKAQALLEKLP